MLLLCVAVSLAGCSSHLLRGAPVSSEMATILSRRLVGGSDINVEGLPISREQDLPSEANRYIEVFDVPQNHSGNDIFNYRVIFDKTKMRYWIMRSGGITGKTTFYGPGEFVVGVRP